MKKILLTGFEPFSDIKKNPSETLVNDLYDSLQSSGNLNVQKIIFPVDYEKAETALENVDFKQFDFIFQFGVAAKRERISLERVALNWIESQIPDNSGVHINEKKIDSALPAAIFNLLDLARINQHLNLKFDSCSEVSLSAGAYLCNFVYFKTLSKIPNTVFVHIPTRLKQTHQDCTHDSLEYRNTVQSIAMEIIKFVL